MIWIVEAPTRRLTPGRLLWTALRAEIRHLWWLQLAVFGAGLGVYALLAVVTENASVNPRAGAVVFNYLNSLILGVFPLLLVASGSTHTGHQGRIGLWLQLPLTPGAVSRLRIAALAFHAWPIVLTWPPIMLLVRDVYGPTPAWTIVNALLIVAVGVLLSLRTRFGAFAIFFFMPLHTLLLYFVPGGEEPARIWAGFLSSYWATAGLLVLTAGLGYTGGRAQPPLTNG